MQLVFEKQVSKFGELKPIYLSFWIKYSFPLKRKEMQMVDNWVTLSECWHLFYTIYGVFQSFEFCSYASAVFATLRRAVGISEESFVQSLAPDELPYLEFISNSKGGQDFFLT